MTVEKTTEQFDKQQKCGGTLDPANALPVSSGDHGLPDLPCGDVLGVVHGRRAVAVYDNCEELHS